uniref:uncharacterized protein isoform X2 n=1 Tax=Pristiophorus japonicus TaxID=55135 RepID=UPI00398EC7A6
MDKRFFYIHHDFHEKFKNKINMSIKVSRKYYLQDRNVQHSLGDLSKRDISIKVMDGKDFAECYYLFVEDGHTAAFEPWHDLDEYYECFSKELANLLDLPSEETEADGEVRNRVNSDGVYCNAEACRSAAHQLRECRLLHAPYLTPKKNVSEEEESTPQFQTPEKVNPSDNRRGVGARRMLFK